MLPYTTPPTYPPIPPGKFGAAIVKAGDAGTPAAACRVALIGLADDTGVAMNHGRPGAREGPAAFRSALSRYGVAQPGDGVAMPRVYDAGDIIPGKTLNETHDRITSAVEGALALNLLPVGIGGGHDLTYPFVRALANRRGVSRGFYVDAHLDVRPEAGSGMPMRALIERCGVKAITNFGACPLVNSREHWEWFTGHGGTIIRADGPAHQAAEEEGLAVARLVGGAPMFVSIDLDALDVSHAPGVSAINPCGLGVRTVERLALAAGRSPAVQCFDIMELNPSHDRDHQTSRLAVHLFLTFLVGLAERPA